MIEVFKTNVTDKQQARRLIDIICDRYEHYNVNFDLDDCDRVLRVESSHSIDANSLLTLLRDQTVQAEILPD